MPTNQELMDAFAKISGKYKNAKNILPAPTTEEYNRNYVAPKVAPISPGAFGTSGGAGNEPLWMKALTGLSGVGHSLTQNFANWTDGELNARDIPFADSLVGAASGQLDAWKDGKIGFGDIPGLGALYGLGKNGDGFGKALTNLGAKEGGKVDRWGGLAGDIVFDPLNLVTFGAGSAIKAGSKAMQVAAKGMAKEAGIAAGKNAYKTLPDELANAYKAKWANAPDIDPYQLDDIAKSIHADTTKKIFEAGAAARNKAQNALFSLDMPFTKMTTQFGSKPSWLKVSDAKIGATGAASVNDLFRTVGLNPDDPAHATQISKMLAEKFGVSSADQLTTQGLKHLQDELGQWAGKTPEFNPRVDSQHVASDLNPTMSYNKFNIDDILAKLRSPKYGENFLEKFGLKGAETSRLASEGVDIAEHQAGKLHELSNSYNRPSVYNQTDDLRTLADGLRGAENTASIKYNPSSVYKHLESLAAADRMTGQRVGANLRKFVQDMGGSSKLGTSLSKFNAFNPRSFNSADPLANEAAGSLRDAQGLISGLTRHTNEQLAAISKAAEGLTEAEKKAIPYYIEKAFPKNFDRTSVNEAKIQEVAGMMKGVLDKVGERGLASGEIKSLLNNYFPHVMKPGAKGIDDPNIAKLLGKNQTSGFGKERTGFDNMAQMDDAIAALKNEAAAATDPAKAEELLQSAARLQDLFERNPIDALGHRAYENIKASSMADLYTKLEKDGLIVKSLKDPASIDRGLNAATKDYHVLTKQEAGALGLPEGAMVHPDVFEGMKDVRELFTLKGMNTFVAGMNKAVSVWKSLVTSYVPAHYVNNFIGNIANNSLAGVGPKSYTQAYDILKAAKAGSLSPEQTKLMEKAYENGVFGQGFSSEFVKSRFSTDKTGNLDKIADAMTHNKYASTMRKVGDKIDDFSRMALFMHGYEQTGSFSHAGKMVSKYLFNYNIQSNADKAVRSVVPFWTWTKNNLPLQIQGIMQQPRYYETYQRVREAFNADVQPQEGKEFQTQDYLHIPGTNLGAPLRSLPMNDLSKFSENPLDTLRKVMGELLSPVVKDPFEIPLNKQFFNNQPIYHQGEDPTAKIAGYLRKQTGVGDKLYNLATSEDGSDLLSNLAAIFTGKPTVYK